MMHGLANCKFLKILSLFCSLFDPVESQLVARRLTSMDKKTDFCFVAEISRSSTPQWKTVSSCGQIVNLTAQSKYKKKKKRVTEDTSTRTPNVQSKHNITKYGIIYLAY